VFFRWSCRAFFQYGMDNRCHLYLRHQGSARNALLCSNIVNVSGLHCTSFGWGKGGNVSSVGWQVTLCDPIWRLSYHCAVAWLDCELLYPYILLLLIHLQHYIHGSSQGQFIVETYIVIFLRILFSSCLAVALTMSHTVIFMKFLSWCEMAPFW